MKVLPLLFVVGLVVSAPVDSSSSNEVGNSNDQEIQVNSQELQLAAAAAEFNDNILNLRIGEIKSYVPQEFEDFADNLTIKETIFLRKSVHMVQYTNARGLFMLIAPELEEKLKVLESELTRKFNALEESTQHFLIKLWDRMKDYGAAVGGKEKHEAGKRAVQVFLDIDSRDGLKKDVIRHWPDLGILFKSKFYASFVKLLRLLLAFEETEESKSFLQKPFAFY